MNSTKSKNAKNFYPACPACPIGPEDRIGVKFFGKETEGDLTRANNSLFLRTGLFAGFCVAGGALFWEPLRELAGLSLDDALYSHIGLIPLFSIAIIFLKRRVVFSRIKFAPVIGAAVVLPGVILLLVGKVYQLELVTRDYLSLYTSGLLLWVIGGFVGIYGKQAFQRAMFPLLFLFFTVPVPTAILDQSILFLQHMTADTVDVLFGTIGLPYLRTDMVFQLPEVTIEVAEQCSGIRSSLALIITAISCRVRFSGNRLAAAFSGAGHYPDNDL